jgi:hypothetical protein
MKSRTLLIFALSSLLLTACNEGDPPPGGYAVFIPAGTIERGFSRADWLEKLQKAGLQGEPVLVYPGRKAPRK